MAAYAVINRLQNFKGMPSLQQPHQGQPRKAALQRWTSPSTPSRWALLARRCESLADLEAALDWARTTDRTTVISIVTDAFSWVPGDADWDVGVPEVSTRESVREAREKQIAIRGKQRLGV
jgi:3D-(3,5/4)-trihydroxycyclohexane-1,2-dione acylhydrolase (decyclizing)